MKRKNERSIYCLFDCYVLFRPRRTSARRQLCVLTPPTRKPWDTNGVGDDLAEWSLTLVEKKFRKRHNDDDVRSTRGTISHIHGNNKQTNKKEKKKRST